METLAEFFSALCGQAPDHTWAPGGLWLPCCQRCTGLYAGAFLALLLHLACQPRLTPRFLQIHGLFLLLMVPFGYHWLPQGPVLRALTGLLFGFGVVTFLLLPLSKAGGGARDAHYLYGTGLSAALVPLLGTLGGLAAGWILTGAVAAGGLAVAMLLLANAILGLMAALRLFRRLAQRLVSV